jgi:hypothetical protein
MCKMGTTTRCLPSASGLLTVPRQLRIITRHSKGALRHNAPAASPLVAFSQRAVASLVARECASPLVTHGTVRQTPAQRSPVREGDERQRDVSAPEIFSTCECRRARLRVDWSTFAVHDWQWHALVMFATCTPID